MDRRFAGMLVAVVLIAAATVAGCGDDDDGGGSGGGGGGKEITVGWSMPDITGVYRTATKFFEQAVDQANQAGFDVEVLGRSTSAHNDYAAQLGVIEDFISQQADVIITAPTDIQAIAPAIKQANEAGIPVVVLNQLEEQEGLEVASYIGFSNADAAKVSAYAILDYYGGPGVLGEGEKVDVKPDEFLDLAFWEKTYEGVDPNDIQASGAIIEGIAGTLFSVERLKGFREVMGEYPGIKVLGEPIAADWNREKGVGAAEDFLTRYGPSEMDFIWAASNEMGLGAIQAAKREGVLNDSGGEKPQPEGTVSIFTNDVTPESADAARAGTLMAETHHGFPEWGWFGAETAVKLACGEKVPPQQDIRPRTMYAANADQFYPEPKLPEIDWKQIAANCE